MGKDIYISTTQKKVGVTNMKVDFRAKNSIRNNESHFTVINGLIKISLTIYTSQNMTSRYMKLN